MVAIAVVALIGGLLSAPATALAPVLDVKAVEAGAHFTCAILADDTVRCWGEQSDGRATPPSDLGTVSAIAAGNFHACAVTAGGTARCWGSDLAGQTAVPADLGPVTAITARDGHTCAIRAADGTARCWGKNDDGQTDVPVDLGAISAISTGDTHTCAIRAADGTARCWGSNGNGQTDVPADLGTPTAIATGGLHTCAITTDGTTRCWGHNGLGQTDVPADLGPARAITGDGHTCAITTDGSARCWGFNLSGQTDVPADLGPVSAITAGVEHTCAITANETARCWGDNGIGVTDVPVDLGPATAITAGLFHTCAITTDGTARCWGWNGEGQTEVPADLGSVSTITTGRRHTCAITTDGTTRCWGWNDNGQTDVPGDLGPVTAITGGGLHTCAITTNGIARCWGDNDNGQTNVPGDVGPATAITAGNTHTCAITTDGSARCWGDNTFGQAAAPGSEPLRAISAGGVLHTCAVDVDDRPVCWGNAPGGVLGGSPLLDTLAPAVAVQGQPYRYRAFTQGAVQPRVLLADGALPDGLTLAPTGAITGTPTTPGTYPLTLAAVNDVFPTTLRQVTITIAGARPDVTVEQAAGQADPTSSRNVRFTITFTAPVTGLDPDDLDVGGTATTNPPTLTGDGTTYTATIHANTNGTITLAVPANVATTADGGLNNASNSADNTITVNAPPPSPPPPPPAPAPPPPPVSTAPERANDATPIEAAIQVADERGAPNGFVVLARADIAADAIAGSVYLADAPLLFTHPETLPPAVFDQIIELLDDNGEVIILGGPAAVSPAIQQQLDDASLTTIRAAGVTRVETSVAIAEEARDRYGERPSIGIARAYSASTDPAGAWADTVAGGGWAAINRSPILLTPTGQAHPAILAWLTEQEPPARTVLGGPAAVAEETASQFGATSRVGGAERSATSVAISDQLIDDAPPGYYLTSNTHPDGWTHALLAAGLTADTGHPLLTTPTTTLATPINDATCRTAGRKPITILGPTSVVSHDVADALGQPCDG